MQFWTFRLHRNQLNAFFSKCKNTVGLRPHKDNKLLAKRVYEPFIFCPIILNSVFMKYQVLFEHPCLQMKRYFCSTLMLSAWWENRTDQPGAQYHFIITDRLFLWCNAPISLSFLYLYVENIAY